MFCTNCGIEISRDVSYCPKCDRRIYSQSERKEIIEFNKIMENLRTNSNTEDESEDSIYFNNFKENYPEVYVLLEGLYYKFTDDNFAKSRRIQTEDKKYILFDAFEDLIENNWGGHLGGINFYLEQSKKEFEKAKTSEFETLYPRAFKILQDKFNAYHSRTSRRSDEIYEEFTHLDEWIENYKKQVIENGGREDEWETFLETGKMAWKKRFDKVAEKYDWDS
jgi:hypothetical protein